MGNVYSFVYRLFLWYANTRVDCFSLFPCLYSSFMSDIRRECTIWRKWKYYISSVQTHLHLKICWCGDKPWIPSFPMCFFPPPLPLFLPLSNSLPPSLSHTQIVCFNYCVVTHFWRIDIAKQYGWYTRIESTSTYICSFEEAGFISRL